MPLLLAFTGCPGAPADLEAETAVTWSWADSLLRTLTLEEKVGQMLMIDLPVTGSIADEDVRAALRDRLSRTHAGGVVLFAADAVPTAQTVAWAQYASQVPLLVALDAEWGAGYRLEGLTRLPDAMAFSATGNPERARWAGQVTAREAASAGISVLFAPTVDVNTQPANPVIGTRSYADHPDSVARYASAFAAGVASVGLLPVLKHFPGHGATSRDSHVDLPIAESDDASFMNVHVAPFRSVLSRVEAGVMTAHVIPRGHAYADTVAATFSHRVVTELLRDSLAFKGLVFTDALNMAGAASAGTTAERAIRAIEAGADVLLMPPDEEGTWLAIIEAVRSGRLSAARIDSSAARILRTKEALRLHAASFPGVTQELFAAIERPDNRREARYVAREAVTVLKDDLPLPLAASGSILLVSVEHRAARRQP
ncbi:MAG: beta-N-acetylglucosaminidase, partial [Bacteroidetes bacterium]|nr:beta-N-acetylglucosaminidase [Bacteroidota bacterium]